MNNRSKLTEPTKPARPIDRYGTLIVILVLVAWEIQWHLTLPPTYNGDPYRLDVGIIMLLFVHLGSHYKWHPFLAVILRVLTWSWIFFSFFYILYLSHALYPSSPSLLAW